MTGFTFYIKFLAVAAVFVVFSGGSIGQPTDSPSRFLLEVVAVHLKKPDLKTAIDKSIGTKLAFKTEVFSKRDRFIEQADGYLTNIVVRQFADRHKFFGYVPTVIINSAEIWNIRKS